MKPLARIHWSTIVHAIPEAASQAHQKALPALQNVRSPVYRGCQSDGQMRYAAVYAAWCVSRGADNRASGILLASRAHGSSAYNAARLAQAATQAAVYASGAQ